MKLYSAWYCPFAQRAWMTLVHKQIPFEYIEVDPYRQSDWWMTLSRGEGLVPVLVVPGADGTGATTIIESNRIIELLDHLDPRAPLFSNLPCVQAEQKYWIDTIGKRITPTFYQLLRTPDNDPEQPALKDQLLNAIETVAAALDSAGPFFDGEQVGAVDISWFPIAYRIELLLSHYRDLRLPQQGVQWQQYHRWSAAMRNIPAFAITAYDQGDYETRLINHYRSYTAKPPGAS